MVGFDLTKLHATGAAILHQEHGDPFPAMIWPTNYNKLACGTMFTLFFAGNDLAPQLVIEGVPIQEYLQSHFIHAIQQVALRLKYLPNVVGYDILNEPSNGSSVKLISTSIPGNTRLFGRHPPCSRACNWVRVMLRWWMITSLV
jgi:hypothetical protein